MGRKRQPSLLTALGVAFLLSACASKELGDSSAQRKTDSESAQITKEALKAEQEAALKTKAESFDSFLRGTIEADKFVQLNHACHTAPEKNLFCFSVVNHAYFTEKLIAKKRPMRRRKRTRRLYPKFRRGRLQNWNTLRSVSVGATLGPIARVRKSRRDAVKKKALAEKTCPLNIAISLASSLEDDLPGKSDLGEIAVLYEKGANCLRKHSPDRAALLTRAGLFYLLDKKTQKAYDVFVAAANVKALNSRPLYWKHRAELMLGKKDEAEKTLDSLIEKYPFSFHTAVAQTAANGDPGQLLRRPHQRSKRSEEVPTFNLLVEQVEVLHKFGFDDSAREILQWAVMEADGVEPEVVIYLAELKHEKTDNHLEKIKILAGVLFDYPELVSKKTMELYFPQPYYPIFEKHSSGLDPYLLLAIARQESAFNPKAISHAKAYGLLQIIAPTGRQVSNATVKQLLEPEMNIKTGAKYFKQLLERLNGQIHYSLAAYNAGPKKLNVWLKRYPTTDPILFIDVLPYRETRNYIAYVLRNYYWYRRMQGGEADDANEIAKRVFDLSAEIQ